MVVGITAKAGAIPVHFSVYVLMITASSFKLILLLPVSRIYLSQQKLCWLSEDRSHEHACSRGGIY